MSSAVGRRITYFNFARHHSAPGGYYGKQILCNSLFCHMLDCRKAECSCYFSLQNVCLSSLNKASLLKFKSPPQKINAKFPCKILYANPEKEKPLLASNRPANLQRHPSIRNSPRQKNSLRFPIPFKKSLQTPNGKA